MAKDADRKRSLRIDFSSTLRLRIEAAVYFFCKGRIRIKEVSLYSSTVLSCLSAFRVCLKCGCGDLRALVPSRWLGCPPFPSLQSEFFTRRYAIQLDLDTGLDFCFSRSKVGDLGAILARNAGWHLTNIFRILHEQLRIRPQRILLHALWLSPTPLPPLSPHPPFLPFRLFEYEFGIILV